MKFLTYINENTEQLSDILKKNVHKKFLQMCFKEKNFFFRGYDNINSFGIIKRIKNRKPRDMPIIIQNRADEWFKKKFGWKVRSEGVFCSQKKYHASGYGTPCYFFPIGKFRYIWSKFTDDLFYEIEKEYNIFRSDMAEKKNVIYDNFSLCLSFPEEFLDMLDDILEKQNFIDHSFNKMWDLNGGKEIIFDCNEYLLVDCDEYEIQDILTEIEKII